MRFLKKWEWISLFLSLIILCGTVFGINRLGDYGQMVYFVVLISLLTYLIYTMKKQNAWGGNHPRERLFFGLGIAVLALTGGWLAYALTPEINKWVTSLLIGCAAGLACYFFNRYLKNKP